MTMTAEEVMRAAIDTAARPMLNIVEREIITPRILAALAAAGWAVVPKEPTAQMGRAAYSAWDLFGPEATMGPEEVIAIYRAMLAAAIADIPTSGLQTDKS